MAGSYFRNFGLVNIELLAKTLSCSVNIIKKEAKRLGIDHITFNPLWRERSYITIIRNNWSILPTDQIITLLDMTKEQLDFELKENDFLDVKLGKKPYCEKVKYSPLNEEEKRITSSIKRVIRKSFIEEYKQPFSFDYLEVSNNINNSNLRIVYPYSAPHGDALINSFDIVNENELIAMQKAGINGIWIQGLLSELSHYPFDGKNDEKFKIRRENLRKFIAKAQNFGIGVYLYFNEPRSININKISSEFKHLIGRVEEDQAALCISQKEIQDYLYLSTKDLLDEVPEISGIMTITSSENLTHCKHKPGSNCTKCSDYKPYELAALINNIIFNAAKESKSNAKIIANLWGWADYCDYTQSDIKKGIKLLNKDIIVMCVSEFGTHKKGKERYIIDEYSISHGEPCLETVSNLKTASNLGHKVMAKLQVNTSWEMPTIPYLPVFENVVNHLEKLRKLNVNDYFASWTLGGYPSVTMNLLSSFNDDFNYDQWLKEIYKNNSEKIKKAVHYFSKGFSYLPFEQNTLYFSPIGLGPISPLFIKKPTLMQQWLHSHMMILING